MKKQKVIKLIKKWQNLLGLHHRNILITFSPIREEANALGQSRNMTYCNYSDLYINLNGITTKEELEITIIHELLHIKQRHLIDIFDSLEPQLSQAENRLFMIYSEEHTEDMAHLIYKIYSRA